MTKPVELFDAYDMNENKLNIDMIRGEDHENGLYHLVVEIFTINERNEILVTKRHPLKTNPLYWEVTGGSVIKGETLYQGAVRELHEETGIKVTEADLHLIYKMINEDCLYRGFVTFIKTEEQTICLQEEETIDYQWIPLNEFEKFIFEVPFLKKRFLANIEAFFQFVYKRTL